MNRKYIYLLYIFLCSCEAATNSQNFYPQSYIDKSYNIDKSYKSKKNNINFKTNNILKSTLDNIKQFNLPSKIVSDISIIAFSVTCSLWVKNLIFPQVKHTNKIRKTNKIGANKIGANKIDANRSEKSPKMPTQARIVTEPEIVTDPDIVVKIYFKDIEL